MFTSLADPVVQVTSVVSCTAAASEPESQSFTVRRSFRLKYAPCPGVEYDEAGIPIVTVALRMLYVETFEDDMHLLGADIWSAFASKVCNLPNLDCLVLVSKDPAHAATIVREQTALRAIPEEKLVAGKLEWGELEDMGDCGHEEVLVTGCCGGEGGWQFDRT